jgi:hypothetical protein
MGKKPMRFWAGIAGCALALAASPAVAGGHEQLPQLHHRLRVGVVGVVPIDCSLSQSGERDVDIENFQDPMNDTVRAATASLPFSVSCNTPISVSLSSRHGGLKFHGAGTSDSAFTTLIPYSANLDMPGHNRVLRCRSDDMAADHGCEGGIDDAITDGEGKIEVHLRASNDLVLSGAYQDRVTITVTPRLGGCDT